MNLVLDIGKSDLNALENFLSNKKYLFGNNPCVEDAIIFGFTSQIYFVDSGPLNKYFMGNLCFKNKS